MTHDSGTGRPSTRLRRTGWRVGLGAALLGLFASFVGCGSTAPIGGPAQSPLQRDLVADVSGDGAFPHLEALQRIADENGGNRASPGPGYDASVDYVAGVLRSAGFDVTTPTFTVRVDGHGDGEEGNSDGEERRSDGDGRRGDGDGRRGDDEESSGNGDQRASNGDEVTIRNVVAQTRTGDPAHVVMAGAHLDSVPEGPGINDNGSGAASLLEIATRLGSSPKVDNAVRFAFWGSEEVELDGSANYVQSLSTADRSAVMLYLNLDMVASPNPGYFVQGGAGSRSKAAGPAGSAEIAKVRVDQLAATGVAVTPSFE